MAAGLATGYHGPAELTVLRALTGWAPDPWAIAAWLVIAGLYLWGASRVRRAGGCWPAGRVIAFCGGTGLALLATSSGLAAYWPVLFWVRAVQTVLLLLAVPLFLALGRPLTLLIAALPRAGTVVEAVVFSRPARVLTFPAVTALALVLTPFLLYFTPWYQAGFSDAAVRELTWAALVLPGLVFFWTLLRLDPVPKAYPYLVTLWVTLAEVVGDAVLGLAVITDHNLIAGGYYHAVARPWGPSLATDQVLGGGALWILGDLIGLPFLAVQLIAMIRADEAEAVAIDAALDAQDAAAGRPPDLADDQDRGARHGAAPARAAPGPAAAAPRRPWWVSDGRFADRFGPAQVRQPAAAPGPRRRRRGRTAAAPGAERPAADQ